MHKMPLWLLAWTAGVAGAQTVPLTANALANRDVVTLAKAGFNEDFIVDLIHTSQTHFDTSVTGLAELAKEGLTERLIRVMLGPASLDRHPSADRSVSGEGSAGETNPIEERVHVLKRSETAVALVNQTPYHRSMSLFWGLWKKRVEVGPASPANDLPSPLGKAYAPARTSGPAYRTAAYVVYP
ncbi:MAG: hypothetical protein LAP40_12740 [Acidobacteriia bacterium]|nr:hypothetical protein [Terriglobia bacterium]